ncbi:protein kinase domain-containing protein [[Actinomadura] parvosata]|uniref:protein kinase domain-containing protein n=1 Tax=[Actinomadura] parvosata TaxID=1955412 RepID=UPI00406CC4B4
MAPSAERLARLLLKEISASATPEETARLLASGAEERTQGTELVLLQILDRIADHDASRGEGAFADDCQAAVSRLQALPDETDPPVTGLLALICLNATLLQRRFETLTHASVRRVDEFCAALFRQARLGEAIKHLYRPASGEGSREAGIWSELDFGALSYHKAGTTSFITVATPRTLGLTGTHAKLALKCVLFPWNKLGTIAKATEDYARTYGADRTTDVVVQPIASSSRWILMPFQRGRTLHEDLIDFEASAPAMGERLAKAREVGLGLLRALDDLAANEPITSTMPHRQHLDLSPNNIILAPGDSGIRFIDLGRNHLYSRQVGIAEHDDSVYVSPEVKNRGVAPSSDVYSLGVILIRILSGHPPRDGLVPDAIWEFSPALGRVLDDFVEENPRNRLLLVDGSDDPQQLDLRPVQDFFTLACDMAAQEPEADLRWRNRWFARMLPASREVKAQYRQWLLMRRSRADRYRTSSYLLFYSLVATGCWWFIATRTALFSVGDLIGDLSLNQAVSFAPKDMSGKDVMAATITAFTQGLLGAKFYQTILARLTVRKVPGPLARVTEVLIRVMAIIPLPATLLAVMWQPWLWAWVGAVSAMLVTLTHWLITVHANRISAAGSAAGLSTVPSMERVFARGYEQWWWTMLLYAVILAGIAFGLQVGWLRDTYAYVLGLTIVSIGIHYISKLVTAGHAIRGGLARVFSAAERIAILKARGEAAGVPWPLKVRGVSAGGMRAG